MKLFSLITSAIIAGVASSSLWAQASADVPMFPDSGSWGINVHNPFNAEANHALHTQWLRIGVRWHEVEKNARGQYDWSGMDRLLDYHLEKGFRLVLILQVEDMNPLYAADKDNQTLIIDAICKWMGAAAERYKGRSVIIWEISNEPEVFPMGNYWNNPKTYSKMARQAAKLMKAADPNCKIAALSMAWVDRNFMLTALEDGLLREGNIDFVSFHGYHRNGMSPESGLAEDIGWMRTMARRYGPAGKSIGIIDSERGYGIIPPETPRHWGNWRNFANSESEQAAYLARHFLEEIYLGIEISIWYKDMWGEDSYSLYYADDKDPKGLRPMGHVFRNLAALLPDNPKKMKNDMYAVGLVDLPDQVSAPDGIVKVRTFLRTYLVNKAQQQKLIIALWNPVEAFDGKILEKRERVGEHMQTKWRDIRPDDHVEIPLQVRISGLQAQQIKEMQLYDLLAKQTDKAATSVQPDLSDNQICTPVIKVGPTPSIIVVNIAPAPAN